MNDILDTNTSTIQVTKTIINLSEVAKEELLELAEEVSERQKHPKFMRFLKERPMSIKENWQLFLKEKEAKKTFLLKINIDGIKETVGFLLFHNFNPENGSIELGFRVDPKNQSKWICTQAVKQALTHILQKEDINEVVGWHSAFNMGSFNVFKHAGFEIEDFVKKQTFLQNINKITDDFKRKTNKDIFNTTQTKTDKNEKIINKY